MSSYLKGNPDDEIHYFSIVNSLMIVLFLTGVVAMIMLRTLRKDIMAGRINPKIDLISMGEQCTYCPSRGACPKQLQEEAKYS